MISSKIKKTDGNIVDIEGYYDMGSCQCGDIDFSIHIDHTEKRVKYTHNGIGYNPDGYIPYAGKVKSITLNVHGIDIDGYEIVKF